MKNLLKVLLILVFSSPVFADMSTAQMPDPASVTKDEISAMPADQQKAWVTSLTADQYKMLSPDVQNWVMENASDDQKKALGINQ